MRSCLFLHTIVPLSLGLGLIAANCGGNGLIKDCDPGELGCACGSFPECPKDDKNRPTLCCPNPLLNCAEGNICKSLGSPDGPTGTGTGITSSTGTMTTGS